MRADKFFAEKFGSRTKAAEELSAGRILRGNKPLAPQDEVQEGDIFTFISPEKRFVSNGGYKLEKAISAFGYDCRGKIFADIGASTGGFTDCLLQNGAQKVFAVDVGESLLDSKIAADPRVIPMENINARYLKKEDFPCPPDGVVADVSFISLRLILPVIADLLNDGKGAFVLIKPQFECENKGIGKSGIVKKTEHKKIVSKVLSYAEAAGLFPKKITNAPVRKGKNVEYVLWLEKCAESNDTERVKAARKRANGEILSHLDEILRSISEEKKKEEAKA